MIQRVQSIWLLLAALTILCLLFITVVGLASANGYYFLNGFGLRLENATTQSENLPLAVFTIFTGLLSFVNIFNFKNRKLQAKLAWVNILLILGLLFWFFQLAKSVVGLKALDIEPGLFLPLVSIIFNILATSANLNPFACSNIR